MFTHIQPTKEEQIVSATVDGLRWLEKRYSWDFGNAISDAHWLFDAHAKPWDKPLTKEQLRNSDTCPRHNVRLVPESYGDVDAENVCPNCEREIKEGA